MRKEDEPLVAELESLLRGGHAHMSFTEAVADLPEAVIGVKPDGLPYSIWQLVEHIRIAQADMLDFCRNTNYKPLDWPDEYWPKLPQPEHMAAFQASVDAVHQDQNSFIELLKTGDLYKPIPHGDGQTLLREALQIADHNSYHTAQIVILRRLLLD